MNSSTRPLGKRPRRRGPWPWRDMHSKVRNSSLRSKKRSTPSPYIRTSTFLTSLSFLGSASPAAGRPVSHRTW
uniref:Uncharacterized protein n=1 Tax=Arundo donax TaxID=35708 RepID=A0A0A9HDY4_ARUDO